MEYQITRTKIVPPRRRPDLFTRQRLLNVLEELVDFKLVLLIAQAGYGKTTLLMDFAHTTTLAVCWYAVDTLDRDPHRFFAHFIAAIAQRWPNFGAAARAALQSLSTGQGTLDQFVTTVINELYDEVTEHFVLIIDDYHLANEDDQIAMFISQFVQQASENAHLLLASRQLIGLPNLALMVARGYVGGLDYEDLAFTAPEIQQLVAQNFSQHISDEEAQKQVSATAGWITGLLLSAQSKIANIPGRMRRLRAAGVDLYDYLAQQVLDQQPAPIRAFLLRSALLEEFDAPMCAAVLDSSSLPVGENWHELIDQVLRRNLFVLPVGEAGEWLRYHPLFQEFLQKRLAQEAPLEEITILERLAAYYIEQQEWEKAYHYYQRAGNFPAIARMIEQAGVTLYHQGRLVLLNTWLEDLPSTLLQARPALLSLKGAVTAALGEVNQGLKLLNEAEQALRTVGEWQDLVHTLIRRSVVHRLVGEYIAALADADRALDLIAQASNDQDDAAILRALSYRAKGLSLHLTGKLDKSIDCLQASLEIYQTLNDSQNIANISSEIAMVFAAMGHHQQARLLLEQALQIWRTQVNLLSQSIVLNNLGVLYHMQGEYLQAVSCLEEAHNCAQRSGYVRFIVFSLASLGDLLVDLELWGSAQKIYVEAFQMAQRINERFLLLHLQLAIARVACATGDWEQAFAHLDATSHIVLDKKSSYEWGLYQLAMGRYYLVQAKATAAVTALEDASERFAESGQPNEKTVAHFFLAAAYHRLSKPEKAKEYLAQALKVTFSLESRYPLFSALREIKSFLQAAQTFAEVGDKVKRLLLDLETFEQSLPELNRRLRQSAGTALADLFVHAEPKLVIHTLGRTEVIVNGHVITTSEWQTQVSRNILLCLLAHPNGLSKEEISDLFWPDATINEAKTRFKNAIYRLRSALNLEVILFENDFYRFNRTLDYEYDLDLFFQRVALGDEARDSSIQISAYQKATQLYRGDYLPDVEEPWALTERERVHRIFLDKILKLARLQFEIGDLGGSLDTCYRALLDDPCLEEAHRLAMRIHAATGNRAAIVRQFAQCRQALQDEVDAPPSAQTEALYAALMRS